MSSEGNMEILPAISPSTTVLNVVDTPSKTAPQISFVSAANPLITSWHTSFTGDPATCKLAVSGDNLTVSIQTRLTSVLL